MKLFFLTLLLSLVVTMPTLAQSYEPPLPPPDQRKPGVTYSDPIKIGGVKNETGMFVGAGLGFGQARTTEEGQSPGQAFLGQLELGYQFKRSIWSRLEAGLQLSSGQVAYSVDDSDIKIPVGFGLLARFGYGYSLGQSAFGIFKVGVGPVQGKYDIDVDGSKFKSDGTVSGLAAQFAYGVVFPAADSIDLTGGLAWTHTRFEGTKIDGIDFDDQLVNTLMLELGVRFRP